MNLRKTVTFLALAALAAPISAQQKSAAPQPAPAARPGNPAPIQTIPQLCRYREIEIVQYSRVISERTNEVRQETDQTKVTNLNNQLNALRGNLVFLEGSWDRLGCAALVYGAPAR